MWCIIIRLYIVLLTKTSERKKNWKIICIDRTFLCVRKVDLNCGLGYEFLVGVFAGIVLDLSMGGLRYVVG